jgi:acetyl-CoA C-acetyltransferase
MPEKIIIAGTVRTAIGKFGGALAGIPASDLGAAVITEALRRSKVKACLVDEVFMGCVLQAGLGQNPARQAALKAGLPVTAQATTVNNVCGSGLKSVNLGAVLIAAGEAEVIVAGGMENMSASPFILDHARFGYRMNNGVLKDAMISDALWDAMNDYHMGITAENIAEKYGITRNMQDGFAACSQQKCEAARKDGRFAGEILSLDIREKRETLLFEKDEFPRDNVTQASIANLKPSFKADGTVTAANASGINDGAAALVLVSESFALRNGISAEAYFESGASAGVDPAYMGLGAAEAAIKIFKKTGTDAGALSLIEANEAFAAQSIACAMAAGWDKYSEKVNVNGGAIALGHPVGASGCRILVTLIHELMRRGGGRGLACTCVGGGMGVAALVKV